LRLQALLVLVATATASAAAPPGTKTHFRMSEYSTLSEWQARREELRTQVLAAAGLLPLPARTPLNVRRVGRVERPSYSVEKIWLETMPGFFVGGNLYLPKGRDGRFPAVLVAHGHWKNGRVEHRPDYSVPALCINLAAQGYVAFAWDMVGWNDTQQLPHKFGLSREQQLWSFGPLGVQLWNTIRALDFVESLPEVDHSRIAMTGASGGATQTFLAAAVDDRIAVSIPVNQVSTVFQGGSPCENAPGLRIGTFNVEIAAVFAPKPMLLIATTQDWTRNTPREEHPQIRAIYELYGKAGQLAMYQQDFEHNYNQVSREHAYGFLRQHLKGEGDGSPVSETLPMDLTRAELLMGTPGGTLTEEQIFAYWKTLPASVEVLKVMVGPLPRGRGSDSDYGTATVRERMDKQTTEPRPRGRGWSPSAIEIRPSTIPTPSAYGGGRYFHTFNPSKDALRVRHILSAIAAAPPDAKLVCYEEAAAWCAIAVKLADRPVELEQVRPKATDVFIPGLSRVLGPQAARFVPAR
jgi:dienelactone hydrolase